MLAVAVAGAASAQTSSLVYVTYLTDVNAGATSVYTITNNNPQLTATLNIGGGGPAAVDAQENVYVIPADLDANLYQQTATVYRFAKGGSEGTKLFTINQLGAEVMTVGADGTVYIAGQVPETTTFQVVKLSPPDYTLQVLDSDDNPRYPTGISVDSTGNVFVGYLDSAKGTPIDNCAGGCILEFTGSTSKLRLPDLAANSMAAGPFVKTDGTLVFWTSSPGRFNYIETVPSGRSYPTSVLQLSPTLFSGGNTALAFNGGGSELWATGFGFNGLLGTNVYGINYPSGTTATTFPVDSPDNLIFITGLAVSPAYFP